jgi:hypothetical protein
MASTSAQLSALERPEVLDEIFDFVGLKQWLFLGAVSKGWAALYLSRESETIHASQSEPALPLHRKVTSYKAVAASLRRTLYACKCDRTLEDDELDVLSRAAALIGSSEVLI